MPNNLEVDLAVGIVKIVFIAAVLGVPFWIASFGLWYLFLAIPAGILIYGVGLGLVMDRMHKEGYEQGTPDTKGSITWSTEAQERAARVNSKEEKQNDDTT